MTDTDASPTPNRKMLGDLLQAGAIDLVGSPLLDTPPAPLPVNFDIEKIEGMTLGLAIGDGLGNTTERKLPSPRRLSYGEIQDYLCNNHADGDCPDLRASTERR